MLVCDVMLVGWLWYGLAMTTWADSFSDRESSEAREAARQAAWVCGGAALLLGSGFLALRFRVTGVVQVLVLGGAAGLFLTAAR